MSTINIKILSVFIFICIQAVAADFRTDTGDYFKISNSKVVTIDSHVLGRKYDLYIKVPYGYFDDENQSKKYPVLYLNDAPHTFKVAAGVTHFRQMDKAIIVAISFAHGDNGQFSRVRDLTPEADDSWTNYETGGALNYVRFIEEEVFAYIDNHYRVDKSKRVLSGHSLGGSFGAWVLLTKPHLFSAYILTSPSLWFKKDLIFKIEEEYSRKNSTLNAFVYIATGGLETIEHDMRNDLVKGHRRFIEQLQSRNYKGLLLKDEIVEGTDHYSTFPVGLAKGLRLFFHH